MSEQPSHATSDDPIERVRAAARAMSVDRLQVWSEAMLRSASRQADADDPEGAALWHAISLLLASEAGRRGADPGPGEDSR